MTTKITLGIKISVFVYYQSEYSNPEREHFMFSYKVRIENLSDQPVQLLERHWDIFDSIGETTTVDGAGVVGEQPLLNPGDIHEYISGCNLKSDLGYMQGYYKMQRTLDNSQFNVIIPRFNLISTYKLN